MEARDIQERERQRRMTKERSIKTENTFSILQEEDTEPLQEEVDSSQIVKTDKDERKFMKEREENKKSS